MRNTERGDSLVYLSSVLIVAPRRIVKIVMNFIRSCQLRSELPIPEICGKFVEVLENHSIIKSKLNCFMISSYELLKQERHSIQYFTSILFSFFVQNLKGIVLNTYNVSVIFWIIQQTEILKDVDVQFHY